MWQQTGLIGRDRLLEREIYPRAKAKKPPFLLVGQRGVGKTAVLEWAFGQADGNKALLSASTPMRESMLQIVKAWGLKVLDEDKEINPDRAKIAHLETAIMREEQGTLFVDDISSAPPAFLRRFKVWRERFTVHATGVPPFKKEELKRCLWGLKEIKVHPLSQIDRKRLAKRVCAAVGADKPPSDIAMASRGLPGRITAMTQGEIEETAPRVAGEELDLSPVLLLGVSGLVICRYAGIGLNETALYLIGGMGMGMALFLRFILMRGMKK